MSAVYLHMAGGVIISAAFALLVAYSRSLAGALFTAGGLTTVGWIVTLAPLGLVILLGAGIDRLPASTARAIFILYAALVGLSLGSVLLTYSSGSVGYTFVSAAAGFAVLALMGTSTRRDLSGLSAFFTIALVGLIVTMLLNLFMRSGTLDLLTSGVGILLFAGLTAFDAQRLKRQYEEGAADGRNGAAVLGALTLYLDFLNLFLSLLRFTGRERW
ncbi:Bax inhibitor-1/YccA family protein [Edaphosphingomonas haloaromaticamans]|nr:Bax inhibitor-1/YccA family protein [Sphingomonas haloaromaticamans]